MKVRDRQLIKELRQERGLTQRQLATLAKCTQATISAIETGKLKNISEDLGAHIAHWLERRPRELFEKFDEERVDALIMKNEARRNRQRGATSAA
jgi:transcriptional regulator with XRE-family HTH domain